MKSRLARTPTPKATRKSPFLRISGPYTNTQCHNRLSPRGTLLFARRRRPSRSCLRPAPEPLLACTFLVILLQLLVAKHLVLADQREDLLAARRPVVGERVPAQ